MDGVIETVQGRISASKLGYILPHEHILVDFSQGFLPHPPLPDGRILGDLPLSLENMGLIRRFPYSVHGNLIMDDVQEAKSELELFKLANGGTICEMSVVGIRRANHSLADLKNISIASGVNIIAASGFYCEKFLPDWAKVMSLRGMADFMIEELVEGGVQECGIKCGLMYIGCSHPLQEVEKRALEAAAVVHKHTGVAMAIHPGRDAQSPFDILKVLDANGVPAQAVCMSHMDRTFSDSPNHLKKMQELCHRGSFVNHSLFGKECSHYFVREFDMPSDAQRIQRIRALIADGCEDRILVSNDVVCKNELSCYGGLSYRHILEHVIPKLRDRGLKQTLVDKICKENPKCWLTCQ